MIDKRNAKPLTVDVKSEADTSTHGGGEIPHSAAHVADKSVIVGTADVKHLMPIIFGRGNKKRAVGTVVSAMTRKGVGIVTATAMTAENTLDVCLCRDRAETAEEVLVTGFLV
jgi:hypothetical protein